MHASVVKDQQQFIISELHMVAQSSCYNNEPWFLYAKIGEASGWAAYATEGTKVS